MMNKDKEPCKHCEIEDVESIDAHRHELFITACCIRIECEYSSDEYIPIKFCPMCGREF